jgi:hypothetical protein
MTGTTDNHASHKPHHVGDVDNVLWGIEKDPLLRQTMTGVLILDQSPDRCRTGFQPTYARYRPAAARQMDSTYITADAPEL